MGFECTYKIDTRYSVEEMYALLQENLPFVTGYEEFDGASALPSIPSKRVYKLKHMKLLTRTSRNNHTTFGQL
jgi:hypothetical protein